MTTARKICFKEPHLSEFRGRDGVQAAVNGMNGNHNKAARRRSPYPQSQSDSDSDSDSESETDSDANSDENDESLQRYKESLGLGAGKDLSDPNDPRVCIIQSLTMESPGRPPVVIGLSAPGSVDNLKKTPFKIKEGATFTMSAQFKVQHEILSGLHYVQVIKRKGIRIPGGKTDEMIVSGDPV
jgi:hypothetical protein